jgi:hypothetical protein
MQSNAVPQLMGRYIVSDNRICHSKPTFRGTRILVADVLDQVAEGMAWESIDIQNKIWTALSAPNTGLSLKHYLKVYIIEGWHDSISKEALKEAVQLARQALLEGVQAHNGN